MCIQLVLFQILTSCNSTCRICVNFTPAVTLQHIASYLSYFLYQVPIQMHHVPHFCESLPLPYKISPDVHLWFPNPFYPHASVATRVSHACVYLVSTRIITLLSNNSSFFPRFRMALIKTAIVPNEQHYWLVFVTASAHTPCSRDCSSKFQRTTIVHSSQFRLIKIKLLVSEATKLSSKIIHLTIQSKFRDPHLRPLFLLTEALPVSKFTELTSQCLHCSGPEGSPHDTPQAWQRPSVFSLSLFSFYTIKLHFLIVSREFR